VEVAAFHVHAVARAYSSLWPYSSPWVSFQTLAAYGRSESDTIEKLIAQMRGVDRPLDRFLIVNGLDRPKIKSGMNYKLITAD